MTRITCLLMWMAVLLILVIGSASLSFADAPGDQADEPTAQSAQPSDDSADRPRAGREGDRRRGRGDGYGPSDMRRDAGRRPMNPGSFDPHDPPPPDDRHGDRPGHQAPDPDQVLAVLNDVMPHLARRLEAVRQQDARRFGVMIRRMGPRLRELIHDKQENPELYQLKVSESRLGFQTIQLIRQLRQAQADPQNQEKAQAIRDELRQVVAEHFDLRQRLLEAKVAAMEKRLEQTREELADRAQRREQLIDQRMEQLLSHRPGERWKRGQPDARNPPD